MAAKILALDPALKTGFAHSNGQYGLWLLEGSVGEHAGRRLIRLEDFILDAQRAWGVDLIAFEESAYGGDFLATKQFHNQVMGVILLVAAKIGARTETYNPSTVKKFATDNGHAKKPQMIRAAKLHYGIEFKSDDTCDAFWMLKLAEHRQTSPLVAAQLAAHSPKKGRKHSTKNSRRRKKQLKLC